MYGHISTTQQHEDGLLGTNLRMRHHNACQMMVVSLADTVGGLGKDRMEGQEQSPLGDGGGNEGKQQVWQVCSRRNSTVQTQELLC